MNTAQRLRQLLAPLGVYRWEGSFQWGELQSEGEALDGVAQTLAELQKEMNLATARGEGLEGVRALLGVTPAAQGPEELAAALAALLRIGGDSFTLADFNDTLRGCGIPAQVEESEKDLTVTVSFPGVQGVPEGFWESKEIIEGILPCHLQVDYVFQEADPEGG